MHFVGFHDEAAIGQSREQGAEAAVPARRALISIRVVAEPLVPHGRGLEGSGRQCLFQR